MLTVIELRNEITRDVGLHVASGATHAFTVETRPPDFVQEEWQPNFAMAVDMRDDAAARELVHDLRSGSGNNISIWKLHAPWIKVEVRRDVHQRLCVYASRPIRVGEPVLVEFTEKFMPYLRQSSNPNTDGGFPLTQRLATRDIAVGELLTIDSVSETQLEELRLPPFRLAPIPEPPEREIPDYFVPQPDKLVFVGTQKEKLNWLERVVKRLTQ